MCSSQLIYVCICSVLFHTGVITLSDVEVNVEELEIFHLPYHPTRVFIGSLVAEVPIFGVLSRSFDVRVSDVLVVFERNCSTQQTPSNAASSLSDQQVFAGIIQTSLQMWIGAYFHVLSHQQSMSTNTSADGGSGKGGSTSGRQITSASLKFATRLFEQANIVFTNLHVRIEEANYESHIHCPIGHEMLASGVCVQTIALRPPTNAEINAGVFANTTSNSHMDAERVQGLQNVKKVLEIKNLCVYCKRDTNCYGGGVHTDADNSSNNSDMTINSTIVRKLFAACCHTHAHNTNSHAPQPNTHKGYILAPTTCVCRLNLYFEPNSLCFGPSTFDVDIPTGVNIHLTDEQLIYVYSVIRSCVEEINYVQTQARWINCVNLNDVSTHTNTNSSTQSNTLSNTHQTSTRAAMLLSPLYNDASRRRARLRWQAIRDFIRAEFWCKYCCTHNPQQEQSADTQTVVSNGTMRWRCWFAMWRLCARYVSLREILIYHVSYETVRDATDGSVESYSIVECLNMDHYCNRHYLRGDRKRLRKFICLYVVFMFSVCYLYDCCTSGCVSKVCDNSVTL
jgi:hypothetical protein